MKKYDPICSYCSPDEDSEGGIEMDSCKDGEYFRCSEVFELLEKLKKDHGECHMIADSKDMDDVCNSEFDQILAINEVIQALKEDENGKIK